MTLSFLNKFESNDSSGFWKVLIVDDEPDIHSITKLALKRYTFEGKEIEFISAYSAKEAKDIMSPMHTSA